MLLHDALLRWAVAFVLIGSRFAGFVLVSPFPGDRIPTAQRVGVVAVLTVFAMGVLPPPAQTFALDLRLVPLAASEVFCGLLVAVAFRFALAAADVLGGALAQTTGLGTPSVLNPSAGTQDTALGTFTALLAILVAVTAGVHRTVLAYLLESFRALPVGTPLAFTATVPVFVELAGEAISVGVRLAMPFIGVSLVTQVVLALVARAAPSLQIFSIGFTILVASGLALLASSLREVGAGLLRHTSGLEPVLERVFAELAGG
jgi:flagellar biosynthetic protein FliR